MGGEPEQSAQTRFVEEQERSGNIQLMGAYEIDDSDGSFENPQHEECERDRRVNVQYAEEPEQSAQTRFVEEHEPLARLRLTQEQEQMAKALLIRLAEQEQLPPNCFPRETVCSRARTVGENSDRGKARIVGQNSVFGIAEQLASPQRVEERD